MIDLTKEECEDYEAVRQGGRTNMFMVSAVVALAPNQTLDKEKCLYIMGHYNELNRKYPDVRGDIK